MWYLLLVAYWEKDSLLFISKSYLHTQQQQHGINTKSHWKTNLWEEKKLSKPRISTIKFSYQDQSCHTKHKESESRSKNQSQWDPTMWMWYNFQNPSNKITTPRRESHFSVKAKQGKYGLTSKYLNDSPHKESTILGVESTGQGGFCGERMIATA